MTNQTILTQIENGVGLITLNRPQALDALTAELAREIAEDVDTMGADDQVSAFVLTGSDRAFATGA